MNEPSIVTLGCRLNHAESARIEAILRGQPELSDVAVVNTCAVTAAAMRDSRRAVRRAGIGGRRVIATGCAATIDPAGFARIGAEVMPNAAKPGWTALRGEGERHTRAFVPVQNGCDHACTFCIIPQGRGPSRSRPVPMPSPRSPDWPTGASPKSSSPGST